MYGGCMWDRTGAVVGEDGEVVNEVGDIDLLYKQNYIKYK